jgi:hypothetical protein
MKFSYTHMFFQGHVKERGKKMVDLCNRLNIQIETTKSGTRSTASEVAAVPQEEIKEAGTSEENEEEKWTGLIKRVQDGKEEGLSGAGVGTSKEDEVEGWQGKAW